MDALETALCRVGSAAQRLQVGVILYFIFLLRFAFVIHRLLETALRKVGSAAQRLQVNSGFFRFVW
jgi:hypothetical protein